MNNQLGLENTPLCKTKRQTKIYFAWAKAVVDNLRGAQQGLEKDFDDLINKFR